MQNKVKVYKDMTDEEILITIPKEDNWAGNYRLEYSGKYLTLFGKDSNHPLLPYGSNEEESIEYDEVVLVPAIIESKGIVEWEIVDLELLIIVKIKIACKRER